MLNGEFIGVEENVSVFVIEREFDVISVKKTILRATALGLYFVEINGERVGDAYLTPGWTNYKKTLQVQEYDITSIIQTGKNIIKITVGEGWCCGPLCWDNRRNNYSDKTCVCLDVLMDGACILSTDESWYAHESYIRESSIYHGETVDLTAKCKNLTPIIVSVDRNILIMQMCEPVHCVNRISVKEVIHTPNGETVYDFGQNLVGVVEVITPKLFNGTIVLHHAEILIDGNFYTGNLRSAQAVDKFTAKGQYLFLPEFTFHGFRYIKIDGDEIPAQNITAIVRHTDMQRTGFITTDNERIQRLYENVIWGQKGNFVDIPSDCPQRDERLGWTGDINAFCRTAAYNYDIRKFMKKWLKTLRDDQRENGEIPHVSPNILQWYHTGAMWSDVITMVPWKLYQMYGDKTFLEDNFEAMQKFIAMREQTMENGLIAKGQEYGDWLALDGEILADNYCGGRTDVYFLTNVLHVESLKTVWQTADAIGKKSEAEIYRKKYNSHLSKVREEYFTNKGRLVFDTVTAQVVSLYFGIVPEEHRAKIAGTLNENVKKHDYRMTTGFIGSPFVLFALADNGYYETARRVLMNNSYPGWLYEVDMGATTVWERWNSLMPNGKPNQDGMNSYNHYAYGSVMEFFYRRIVGIEAKEAGFRKIRINPHPLKCLPMISAEYKSVVGDIKVKYAESNGKITYEITIPDGIEADICLPDENSVFVIGGKHVFERESISLSNEPYTEESTITEVFGNPKALKVFRGLFSKAFDDDEIMRMCSEHKTLHDLAAFCDEKGIMTISEFYDNLSVANKQFLL